MNSTPASAPTTSCTRRDFVGRLAAAGAALPLAGVAVGTASRVAAATTPAAAGPGVIHVFSKPFHMLSHAETAKLIAGSGAGGIDYTVRTQQPHVLPAKVTEDLPRAVEAAHKAGLKVEMITTDIKSVKEPHTEAVLKAAAKAGVKVYRLGNWNYDLKLGVEGTIEKLRPDFRELAALNQSLGLHGAVQNHAGARLGGAVWDLHLLLRDIDPRWVGVQYDIRHAVVEGAQSWPLALRLLAPWIRCTDIKDFKWLQAPGKGTIDNVPLGEGIVPFAAYCKLAKELNVGGPISLHLEYPPFERAPAGLSAADRIAQMKTLMKKDVDFLKAQLAKAKLA